LKIELAKIVLGNGERLTLSVKAVNFTLFFVVKAFVWEILIIATFNLISYWVIMMHLNAAFVFLRLSYHPLVCGIPDEMVVHIAVRVEKVDKDLIYTNPAAGDKRVRKIIDNHSIIIKTNELINFDL
jgi:hypothetical protein